MTTKPSGFSLIELMIVIAIVGVTASVAVPAYQNYLGRSKVSEALQMAGPYQKAIAECYSTSGTMSGCSNNSNGISESASGTYGSLAATDGNIVFTFNSAAKPLPAGSTFTLSPRVTTSNDPITWDCSSTLDKSYLPSTCSESAASPAASPASPTAGCPSGYTSVTVADWLMCRDPNGYSTPVTSCPSGFIQYTNYCKDPNYTGP